MRVFPLTPDATPPAKDAVAPLFEHVSAKPDSIGLLTPPSSSTSIKSARSGQARSSFSSHGIVPQLMERLFSGSSSASKADVKIETLAAKPSLAGLREYDEINQAWIGSGSSFLTSAKTNSNPTGSTHPLNWPRKVGEFWHIPNPPVGKAARKDFIIPVNQAHHLLQKFSFIFDADKAADRYVDAIYPAHDVRKIIAIRPAKTNYRNLHIANAYVAVEDLSQRMQRNYSTSRGQERSESDRTPIAHPEVFSDEYSEYRRVFSSDVYDSRHQTRPSTVLTEQALADFHQLLRDVTRSNHTL